MSELQPNQGKSLVADIDGVPHARYPIRTHVVSADDTLVEVARQYAGPHLQPGDVLFISERVAAVTQGRAIPIDQIKPRPLANFLVRFVHKSPHGIGLGSPWTMELALREIGAPRILLGAVAAAVTKPFGVRGVFYRICGRRVASIDGPCSYTLPPGNQCATLGPERPDELAQEVAAALGCGVVIIDANDLGVDVMGRSSGELTDSYCKQAFSDNPLGQSHEQTPLCLVRAAGDTDHEP